MGDWTRSVAERVAQAAVGIAEPERWPSHPARPGTIPWNGSSPAESLGAHGQRLAESAVALGRRLSLTEPEIETLRLGALLHDIGKHAIPPNLLTKATPLTLDEFEIIKQHTVIGDAMCAAVPALSRIRPIVRHHHERLDGSGYPDGTGANGLPLLVQIVGIVDVYDALVHARPYKPALDPGTACTFLALDAARGWRDRELVWEFIELVKARPAPIWRMDAPSA